MLPTVAQPLATAMQPPALQVPGTLDDEQQEVEPIPTPPGHLILSDDQLENLVHRVETRMAEVSKEMGRGVDGAIMPESWMDERLRNQQSYDKDLAWRAAMRGTIFSEGMNLTFGDNARKCRLLSARVRNDLMGTRPFFGCLTARNGNPKLTKQVEEYLQDRVESSNVPETIREGIRTALVVNEAVVKTTYFVDKTPFIGPATGVFVDQGGNPARTSKGELVYDKDDAIPDPSTEGLMRLVKDPTFAFMPGQYGLQDFDALPQELVHYDGALADVVDFRDFLCPLKVNSIHRADINVHLYHQTVEQLGAAYGEQDSALGYFSWRADNRVGAEQAIRIRGEEDTEQSLIIQKVLVAEVYMRCDADEDNREEEIFLVLDVDSHKAIFYDYLGNHMSRRPFAVIPGVEKVAGRWYGIGVFSKMAHPEMYSDAQLNRVNQKDSKVASVTVAHRKAINEWKSGPIVLGGTDILTFAPDWDPQRPPIVRINLMENADLGTELMREMRKAGDDEFGVQSGAAASSLDQNRSNTATGIVDINRDTDLLSKDQEHDIARGIERVLEQAVEMELSNMDETVVAFSADGSELATLNRDEIRHLERKVRLLLTKSRSADMLSTNQAAEACWLRYMRLNPEEQFYGRPFFINELKSLEVDDADDRLPQVTPQQLAAFQQQKAQPPPTPDKPVSESIAIKLTDLTPDERAQALAKAGITASPPQDVANIQAQKTAAEVTVKQAAPPSPPESNPPK